MRLNISYLKLFDWMCFIEKSSNPVVKLCGQLVQSGSRSMFCKNVNYIWSKYNMIASKSDEGSYNTPISMLYTYEKENYETYEINDQLCIHDIKELLFMRETMIS